MQEEPPDPSLEDAISILKSKGIKPSAFGKDPKLMLFLEKPWNKESVKYLADNDLMNISKVVNYDMQVCSVRFLPETGPQFVLDFPDDISESQILFFLLESNAHFEENEWPV